MNCGASLVKYLLIIFNLLCLVIGLILLGFGIKYLIDIKELKDIIGPAASVAPIVVIIIGTIITVTSFCGCCGATRESKCMLGMYAIILVVLVILSIVAASFAFNLLSSADEKVKSEIYKQFDKYNSDKNIQLAFDTVQKEFECCGPQGPEDYNRIFGNKTLPLSCCKNDIPVCSTNLPSEVYYSKGCISPIVDLIDTISKVIGTISIIVMATMGACIFFSLCVCCSIRN